MEALPVVGFALAIGLIVVVTALHSTRRSRHAPTGDSGSPFVWGGGDSGSTDCGEGSSGGDCGGGDGGGGGGGD